ncbi:MAG TPA: hypothetical protein VF434_05550 [Promineifilum sp.]
MQFEIIRPDDLLNLRVEGVNLRLNKNKPKSPYLEVEKKQEPAYLILTFPPQTIAERAYFEAPIIQIPQDPTSGVPADPDAGKTANDPDLDAPGFVESSRPTIAQLGRPSRLVFKVAADQTIPYSVEGILDWSGLELSVNPIAAIGRDPSAEQIAGAPSIQMPKPTETALELPYRLAISPTAGVAWAHRPLPFTHLGRTEMWHTRLQLKAEDGSPEELSPTNTASMRAIWSPDYNPIDPPHPTKEDPDLQRTAMSPNDRHQIVILTSAFKGYVVDKEVTFPFPVAVNPAINPSAVNPNAALVDVSESIVVANPLPGSVVFKKTVPYVPEPFEARELMLSPLGGWLKSRGNWDPPRTAPPVVVDFPFPDDIFSDRLPDRPVPITPPRGPFRPASLFNPAENLGDIVLSPFPFPVEPEKEQLDLSEWVHIATQGRDHYVRIVYEGELWPFRHRAALVKITERKFKEFSSSKVVAYMIQRMFIVVREPEKAFADRGLPFKKVRLTTRVTPDIALPAVIAGTNRSFWVEVLTGPDTDNDRAFFQFHGVGTDAGNFEIDFTIPMMFVSISDLPEASNMKLVANAYNAKSYLETRQANIPGQKVMFAPQNGEPGKATDNTQLVTETINFVVNADLSPPDMLMAGVKIPQVNELLGTDDATVLRYYKDYLNNGFDAATGVFAEIAKLDDVLYVDDNPLAGMVPTTLGAEFRSNQAGGFATPNMAVSTLTRELGPVAGKAADALLDTFDPKEFFGDGLAFLFGTFDLSDLIPGGPLGQNAPHLTTRTEDIAGGKKIVVDLDWNPPLENLDLGIAAFEKDHPPSSVFEIKGHIEKEIKLDGSPAGEPTFDMNGKLTNFQVSVLKCVFINFVEFGFESHSGSKTDVKVTLDPGTPIEFAGDLKFVEELRKAIPPDLFGDGPSLDISLTGVTAGFAFDLPPVSVGVFSLRDVTLGAAMTLPFLDGKPVFDFNVSEREQPFILSVSIFGGGGFFRLQIDTAGMKLLEAALEFGATAALDIGVASGEVHIMAGIYFSLQRKEENPSEVTAVLSGYLRMGGSLNVLGLVKISVEFVLSFTYDSGTEKCYGRATLTVHVEVLFFSASVELTVERGFGGQSGDPRFGEMYDTAEHWSRYALAFA